MTDFAHRLKRARAKAGLTQGQLAAALSVQQSTVGGWESPTSGRRPHRKLLPTLAKVLKTSAEWLETGQGAEFIKGEFGERHYNEIDIDLLAKCLILAHEAHGVDIDADTCEKIAASASNAYAAFSRAQ